MLQNQTQASRKEGRREQRKKNERRKSAKRPRERRIRRGRRRKAKQMHYQMGFNARMSHIILVESLVAMVELEMADTSPVGADTMGLLIVKYFCINLFCINFIAINKVD